ncbi:alpha-fetoprotein-like isoform X7 [Alexandromys fortis]|uniref:alpha-fetoprotein-like isoform X7 n=1 Tax=Alexandromys fortis TaxID=100897 RepID=UPI0021532818|nr:alpha-fetoprotein-like isoform X7 [Microtus fortis]
MEVIKTLFLIAFFSSIKCEPLQTSLLHAGRKPHLLPVWPDARQHINRQDHLEETLRDAAIIMVAQFHRDAAYVKVQTIAEELLDQAEKCKSLRPHESPAECAHQLMGTFLTHICNDQGLMGNQVFSDCCKMEITARLQCFLSSKKDDTDSIDVPLIPRPELTCETDEGTHMSLKTRFSYEISRRYPFLYGPTILTMSACYETAVWSCCQEENKTECLQTKLEPIRRYIREISVRHHHLCEIRIKFDDKIVRAVELILLTKKQPKANFSEIAKLTTDIKNLHEICCEGNTVACALGRHQLMNYTCSHQAILSSKFAQCCEQPEPFRGECIIISENDDKPNLTSLALRKFTEDQSACKQFSDKQDDFLQEFLYEYTRRHLELAVPVILRILATYKQLLEKCCKLGNPVECHRRGKEMFQRVVRESRDRVKTYCDLHRTLGGSNFQDRLTILYTKKAPQLSVQELVAFTRKTAAAASRCCPLSDELQSACVEDAAKLILGALCRRHDAKPVNAGVGRCCDDSYAFRKPCFDDLRVDGTYIPPPLSCDQVISLKEDLCRVQEDELQTEKQKLLSNLVKQRPQAAEDAVQAVGAEFTQLVAMCCHAEERETCFQEEVSHLLSKQRKMLSVAARETLSLCSRTRCHLRIPLNLVNTSTLPHFRASFPCCNGGDHRGTPTDQEVPVPLRGRLIPEYADVGSPTWKITVDQVVSPRPSVGAERWPVHTIFPFPLTNGILTPRRTPQNSTTTGFASQEQWQRRNSKSTQGLQPI